MRVGSLFSGIGGMDLGLERAGMTLAWQVEINSFCQQVLRKHWPLVPKFSDIRTIDWEQVPSVDLVCGGFPCQPFSIAGKQKGASDERYLWPEVVRCLESLNPTWFLGENVPGIGNLALPKIKADLENLGYEVWIASIPACGLDAPHLRQRIWITAYADSYSRRCEEQWGQQSSQQYAQKTIPGLERFCRFQSGGAAWETQPAVCRVVDGIPHRVDRLRGLGNAVVPQLVEVLGRMIMQAEKREAVNV